MNQNEVDQWIENNGDNHATFLLHEKLPNMGAKLDRLDKRIQAVLDEIQKEFPDAQYYTASGGFNLILGDTHDDNGHAQQQRTAWGGGAQIGDGDW